GHPYEHVDAQLLRPRDLKRGQPFKDAVKNRGDPAEIVRRRPLGDVNRQAGAVAMCNREEYDQGCGSNECSDQPLFKVIERTSDHVKSPGTLFAQSHTPVNSSFLSGLAARQSTSFDHLVGELLQRFRQLQSGRSGRLRVDDELKLGRLLDRKVGWL